MARGDGERREGKRPMRSRVARGAERGRSEPWSDQEAEAQAVSSGWCLNHVSTSTLTVPFSSPMEAEIAHRFLTPNGQFQGPVQKELKVTGTVLAVSVVERARGGGSLLGPVSA